MACVTVAFQACNLLSPNIIIQYFDNRDPPSVDTMHMLLSDTTVVVCSHISLLNGRRQSFLSRITAVQHAMGFQFIFIT